MKRHRLLIAAIVAVSVATMLSLRANARAQVRGGLDQELDQPASGFPGSPVEGDTLRIVSSTVAGLIQYLVIDSVRQPTEN